MIASDDDAAARLNSLAQAHWRDTGRAGTGRVPTADGPTISIGDRIVTRRNDRRLKITDQGTGWVKNGDTWTVTASERDGSITVAKPAGQGTAVLPAGYVTNHVELGYATTVHRAQGRTVDTAHALISRTTTREALYVAATRGASANHLYVDTEVDPDHDTSHGDLDSTTAQQALTAVLDRTATVASAHAAMRSGSSAAEWSVPRVPMVENTSDNVPSRGRSPFALTN